MSTPTPPNWTDAAPQQQGWYAQAIASSVVGAHWVFPSCDFFRAGLWDLGPRSIAAIAGPFANSADAWRWARDNVVIYAADEVRSPDDGRDWTSILIARLRGEADRRISEGDNGTADLLSAAASLLLHLNGRAGPEPK